MRGHSLIELLLAFAIIGILVLAGLSTIVPKSPRATRAALVDLRNALQNARQAAISGGKTVKLKLATNANGQWQITVLDTGLAETNAAAILFTDTLPTKMMTYCTLAQQFGDLPTTSTKVTALAPAQSYGFGPGATGWNQCLAAVPANSWYGLNNNGVPVLITGASPNPTVAALAGGFWVGVLGNSPNSQGIPYGVVLVPPTGQVITYYKGDAQLDDTNSHKWSHLE